MTSAETRLAAELLLATKLVDDVIVSEVAAGLSVPHATRPLFQHERDAGTRFSELEDATTAAVRRIQSTTDSLWRTILSWLLGDLLDHSGRGADVLARLVALQTGRARLGPADQQDTVERAASAILRDLLQVRRDWAVATVAEATRQGVAPYLLPDVNMLTPDAEEYAVLAARAEHVARHPQARALEAAARYLADRNLVEADPRALLDDLGEHLGKVPHAGTDDLARRTVYDAGNAGRLHVAQEAPKPEYVYASELMDGATCVPCSHVDGRRWDTIGQATDDYPQGGGYAKCLGGRRCRGTLVFVWPTEAAPTIDNAPRSDDTTG